MVSFQTKNPNLDKFCRVLQWKRMVYFMDSWSILWSFVKFYGHFVKYMVVCFIFPILVFSTKKNLATLEHICMYITLPVCIIYCFSADSEAATINTWVCMYTSRYL
jgi:hypothetical protein